jgi:uroporphyrin-3 C-methyltransferase
MVEETPLEQNEITKNFAHKKTRSHIPILLLAILGLCMGVFAVLQLRFSERNFSLDANRTAKTVSQLQRQVQTTQQSVVNLQKTATLLQTQLQQQLALQPANADQAAWTMAEAEYLLQLANYHLTFMRNVATVVVLLQTVDKRLSSLSDPNLNRIRNLLADALIQLQAVPKVDVAGLLSQLNALQIQAAQLPLLVPMTSSAVVSDLQSQTTPSSNWRTALDKSLKTLQKLIVIRRHDQPIAPLLPQEQQLYLQQNLQLLLQQAQWAVMQGQASVYQNSLQQAEDWTKLYFVSNAAMTQTMLQTLQELKKINIQPTLPDISNVLQALQQVIASETQNKIMEKKS